MACSFPVIRNLIFEVEVGHYYLYSFEEGALHNSTSQGNITLSIFLSISSGVEGLSLCRY